MHAPKISKFLTGKTLQIVASLSVTINAVSDGIAYAWASPIIPILKSPTSPIKITEDNVIWIETLYMIGNMFGLPITIYCVDRYGRKFTIFVAGLFNLMHWILLATCTSIPQMYIARLLTGAAADVAFISVPMYISEIAEQKIRGFLASLIYIMMMVGIVICYSVAPFVSIAISSTIGMIPVLLQLISVPFMPESPYFLLLHDRDEEARENLRALRDGDAIEVDKEFNNIKAGVDRERHDRGHVKDLIMVKSNRKAMIIMTVLNGSQHLSAISVMLMNLHTILADAAAILSATDAAIIFSTLLLITTLFGSSLMDKLGRKVILSVSSLLTSLSLLSLALYFLFKNLGYDVMPYNWIPIVSVMSYAFVFKAGLGLVPIVLTAELFPTNLKALGMTYADAMYGVFGYVGIVIFQNLLPYGMHTPFFIFFGFALATSMFTLVYIPETKGKSLDEIQHILKGIPWENKN